MISIDMNGLDVLQRQLYATDREVKKAVRMGINKTATKAKTEMKRAISSTFAIKQKDVGLRIAIHRAKAGHLEAEINPFKVRRGRSLNLSQFIIGNKERYLRKAGVAPDKQKAIKLRVLKRGSAKTVRGAFLIRARNSGKLIMMRRTGRAQYPIQAVQAIDVPGMFGARRVIDRVETRIRDDLPIEIERALHHVIRRRSS